MGNTYNKPYSISLYFFVWFDLGILNLPENTGFKDAETTYL